MIINIPMFPGFYCSVLDQIIDGAVERETEYLELTDEQQNTLWVSSDYSDVRLTMAQEWLELLQSETFFYNDIDIELTFHSITSPKYYNYETDRLFAEISEADARKLFAMLRGDNRLHDTIKGRFTSCDGFISHYSNDIDEWLDKPLMEWDCNELGTLLLALDLPTNDLCQEPFEKTDNAICEMINYALEEGSTNDL